MLRDYAVESNYVAIPAATIDRLQTIEMDLRLSMIADFQLNIDTNSTRIDQKQIWFHKSVINQWKFGQNESQISHWSFEINFRLK